MAIVTSPSTPKVDYVPAEAGNPLTSSRRLNSQSSLPILAASASNSPDVPACHQTPTDYRNDLQDDAPKFGRNTSPFRKFARVWLSLRWKLSRSVFSVPLPLLTSKLDVKLGDLLITFPISVGLLLSSALKSLDDRDVKATGKYPSYAMILVFFLAARNNAPLVALTGISYERALFYHKIAAVVMTTLAGLHGVAYLLAKHNGEMTGKEDTAATGMMALGAMLLLLVFSINVVRRRYFEVFVRFHWILAIMAVVFAVIHGATTALINFIPWGADVLFRQVYRPRIYAHGQLINRGKTEDPTIRMGVIARRQLSVSVLPGEIVQIQFPRVRNDTGEVFKFKAGQHICINVPAISTLQWHPFSISSAPHEAMVTLHIKTVGDWTQQLYNLVASSGEPTATPTFDVLVDGPYGNLSVDVEDPSTYSHFVLFAGGMGVTPMRSIMNWLHHEVNDSGRSNIEHVHFVWAVRDRQMLNSLALTEAHLIDAESCQQGYFPRHAFSHDPSGTFLSEVYLTQSEDDFEMDRRLGNHQYFSGRPDVAATLRNMGQLAKRAGKKQVAVLVSGPAGMKRQVVRESLSLSSEMKICFDVHSESYQF